MAHHFYTYLKSSIFKRGRSRGDGRVSSDPHLQIFLQLAAPSNLFLLIIFLYTIIDTQTEKVKSEELYNFIRLD